MGTGKINAGGQPAIRPASLPGGAELLLVTSCYRNWDKLGQCGPIVDPSAAFIQFYKLQNNECNILSSDFFYLSRSLMDTLTFAKCANSCLDIK